MRRKRNPSARELSEAKPRQLFAQLLAGRSGSARENHERPFAVPICSRSCIDALRRLGEACAPMVRESIETDATATLRAHPLLVRQPTDRRTHMAVGDAERVHEL